MDTQKYQQALNNIYLLSEKLHLFQCSNDIDILQQLIDTVSTDVTLSETTQYNQMITAFSADFDLALEDNIQLNCLQKFIDSKDEKLLRDIKLLAELEFNLRHNKLKIMEVTQ